MRKFLSAFTLIELLVVIAIIGILSAVGLNVFPGAMERARDSQRKTDIQEIKKALRLYYNDCKGYPLGASKINGCGGSCVPNGTECSWGGEWKRGDTLYMSKIPSDPKTGWTYRYEGSVVSLYEDYTLYACLENKNDSQGQDASVQWPSCTSKRMYVVKPE